MMRKDLILTMSLEAGRAIATIAPSTNTVISKGGRGNYVTLADKTSEEILFTHIRKHFPNDTVMSEETATQVSQKELEDAPHLWIIDPIDGTANYQYNRKYSCISVGYAEKGILTHAVVYDPFREELFVAQRNKGSWRNGKKITVSQSTDIHHSTVITDNSYDPDIVREHLETVLQINPSPWILMKGSAALELCEVASGQADLFFSFCLNPWDNAAGFLIVEEAGGIIVNRIGKKINFFSPEVIAGNPTIIKNFLKTTK